MEKFDNVIFFSEQVEKVTIKSSSEHLEPFKSQMTAFIQEADRSLKKLFDLVILLVVLQGRDSQNFLRQILNILAALSPKMSRILAVQSIFEADIFKGQK